MVKNGNAYGSVLFLYVGLDANFMFNNEDDSCLLRNRCQCDV